MITRLTHSIIYVLELNSAIKFYTTKLGFKIHTDTIVDGDRWLTVCTPEQPDLQILLIVVEESMIFKLNQVKKMSSLLKDQTLTFAVFECKDVKATFTELKKKGVKFFMEPYHNKYLDEYETGFFDDSGNWFRLTQRK